MTQTPTGDSIAPAARTRATEDIAVTEATKPKVVDDGNLVNRSGRGKKILVYTLLVIFALIYIYPFIVQVVTSFKTNGVAVANPLALVPDPITTAAFERLAQTEYPR